MTLSLSEICKLHIPMLQSVANGYLVVVYSIYSIYSIYSFPFHSCSFNQFSNFQITKQTKKPNKQKTQTYITQIYSFLKIPLSISRFGDFSEKLSSFPGLQSERRNSDGTPWCGATVELHLKVVQNENILKETYETDET